MGAPGRRVQLARVGLLPARRGQCVRWIAGTGGPQAGHNRVEVLGAPRALLFCKS
jgi:hypothetical protein